MCSLPTANRRKCWAAQPALRSVVEGGSRDENPMQFALRGALRWAWRLALYARFGRFDFGAPSHHCEHVSVRWALDPSRRFWRLVEPEPNPSDLWSPHCRHAGTDSPAPAGCQLATRATRTAAAHARKGIRTYLSEAPSVVVVVRTRRVTPTPAFRNLALPWFVRREAPRIRSPSARPRRSSSGERRSPSGYPRAFRRVAKMRTTRLLLPTSFDRAPSSRALPIASHRGPWPFTWPRPLRRGDLLGGGRFLPAARLSSEPLTPLTASVAARLGRHRPAARESEQTSLRPEAPSIGEDPLLAGLQQRASATSCAPRRFTPPFRPRLFSPPAPFGAFGRLELDPRPRRRAPRCWRGYPTSLLRIRRRFPTSATCTTHGRTHCEPSILALAGGRALAELPPRLPRCPPSREAGASRSSRLSAVRSARQRATDPLRGPRAGRPETKVPRERAEPLLVFLPSTRLSPAHRHASLECLRRAWASRRPSFPRRPAKDAVFPQTKGAFHRTSHVPG